MAFSRSEIRDRRWFLTRHTARMRVLSAANTTTLQSGFRTPVLYLVLSTSTGTRETAKGQIDRRITVVAVAVPEWFSEQQRR